MTKKLYNVRPACLLVESLETRRLMADVWGAFPKLIGQDAATNNYPAITGKGYAIAVLDTGIDYNHPAFGGNGIGAGKKIVAGYDFVENDADPMDTDGHGTGVAGTAAAKPFYYNGQRYQGVAPEADLVSLRIDPGTFGWAKVAPLAEKALQWVIANHEAYNIAVVNMSYGRGHYQEETTLDPISDELAVLKGLGIAVVSSSGNNGMQGGTWGIEFPAADPNVYGVGSVNVNDVISSFTERNELLDMLAPGEGTVLPYYVPSTGAHVYLNTGNGTSFATASVSGMFALLKQVDPSMTPDQMMSIMKRGGVANYDGDKETPATGLTFARLHVGNALALAFDERDDAREDNDTLGAASGLTFAGDTAAASGLKLLQGDADFYKFTLGAQADVELSLATGGGATPTWELFNANGTKVKTLASTDLVRLGAGTWVIRVNAPSATLAGAYAISIRQTADDSLNNHTPQTAATIVLDGSYQGAISGMKLLGGSPDYFAFELNGLFDVSLDLQGAAGAGAQLLDANGSLIANFDGAALSRRLAGGRYLIKVSSAATLDGTYGVGVIAAPVVLAPPGQSGGANAIAYDATGTLHFAWYDEAAEHLKYATRNTAGVWSSTTVVDGGLAAGQYVTMVLDAAGRAGLAYYDATNADLKYAHFDGADWAVETVDAKFTTGYYPSLRYDVANRPVITYYAKTGGDLKIASYTASGWVLGVIDSTGDAGRYSSLALNPATGRWAVAYADDATGHFKYAEQTKSGWAVATADGTTKTGGGYVSLAFNAANRPVMTYYDAYNADLKFATFNGTKWTAQAIASKGSVGLYSTLRVDDATGALDVLYYSKTADGVFRATSTTGAVWAFEQVTNDGGRSLTRAIDADGEETLAYLRGADIGFLDV